MRPVYSAAGSDADFVLEETCVEVGSVSPGKTLDKNTGKPERQKSAFRDDNET